jgi:membrane protein
MKFFLFSYLKKSFKIIALTFKRFYQDKCPDHSFVISYWAFLGTIPLVALFAYVAAKILGSSEPAFRSLNIFSDEFFVHLDPLFFKRAQYLAKNITSLGWFGLGSSILIGSVVFSKLIYSINYIFKANAKKSFFYNRFLELLLMFAIGGVLLLSLIITGAWTAIHRIIEESELVAKYINPKFVSIINSFFIKYLIPIALTFFVFYALYKFIPHIKVKTQAALIGASVSSLLWELVKRFFAWYIGNFSLMGIVFAKALKGTLASIIYFLIWVTLSLWILLWGAELTAILNEKKYEEI